MDLQGANVQSTVYDKRRAFRLAITGLFILFTGLAGYHWGNFLEAGGGDVSEHDVIILACFSALALILGLYSEFLVLGTEEAARRAEDERRTVSEDAGISREHVKELQRLLTLVTDDNANLTYRLLGDRHQARTREPAQDTPASH